MPAELPDDVVDEAVELSQKAHLPNFPTERFEQERDEVLARYGFRARIRDDESLDRVLVCYPAEWVTDGEVRVSRVEDTGRAVERPLFQTETDEEWSEINAHNQAVVARIREEYSDVHGDNVQAFSDFMSNHYKRRIESASNRELEEFLSEYFPRNAWPSDAQKQVIEESLRMVFTETDASVPTVLD